MHLYGKSEDLKFESISDFKISLLYGKEIKFEWNNITYDIFKESKDIVMYISDNPLKPCHFNDIDKLLDFIIDKKSLRKIITDITVLSRNV